MAHTKLVHFLLRLSIASVFLYAAVAATFQPENWIGYIPQAARDMFPEQILLLGFSFFQVVLSVWLLIGWKTMYAASLAAVTLLGIIGANYTQLDILFRDIAILFAAIALAVGSYKKKK